MNGGYGFIVILLPSPVDPHILFLASIVLCFLTRSAVSVIIAINRRPVSAAVVVCVRVLFLLVTTDDGAHVRLHACHTH